MDKQQVQALIASEKEMVQQRQHPIQQTDRLQIEARFGQNVRRLRQRQHLTQEELAFRCGFQQHYISDIERGKRNVSLRVVELLARALRVKVRELF